MRWMRYAAIPVVQLDVFCLNCVFVIDTAVKQLVSRSFLKHGVSAVAMAAHIFFFF